MSDRHDTRSRIQAIALELFIEQGYDKTSLREIAERLGVTKAALYYHFPTKDDIVSSLIEDRIAQLRALTEWANSQPRTVETRRQVIRRYAEELHEPRAHDVMHFFERNQAAIKQMGTAEQMRTALGELIDALGAADGTLTEQLKTSLAIFAIHASLFVFRNRDASPEQQREAALTVALELIGAD
jgi:AcrR family transcriptional regulator